MIINDLSHVETVLENENVQGGLAIADAYAKAKALGKNFAGIFTSTESYTYSGKYSAAGGTSQSSSASA
ncbi:hypothetical protein [Nostoc sp. ChiQUE01b]|uniref:hypothetical protein n=1 Tax=Nostoc sp. ChiQUE01b TaxID=3075376 RepID=UPI002AD2C1CE|nr:hypothetical protein [Nostoc sp. ChiQUE01b]MDZ8257219.1 hypothetical protein [Nostoc sp. ChiQUE01b]